MTAVDPAIVTPSAPNWIVLGAVVDAWYPMAVELVYPAEA